MHVRRAPSKTWRDSWRATGFVANCRIGIIQCHFVCLTALTMINLDNEFEAAEDDSDYEDEETHPPPVETTGYPERGPLDDTKRFLIKQLDNEGGIDCFTREN